MGNSKLTKQKMVRARMRKLNTLYITTAIIALLVVGALIGRWNIGRENNKYKEYEQVLLDEINKQKSLQKDILEQEAYTKTDQYVESVAKEKIGLVYPDEIIFKPEK